MSSSVLLILLLSLIGSSQGLRGRGGSNPCEGIDHRGGFMYSCCQGNVYYSPLQIDMKAYEACFFKGASGLEASKTLYDRMLFGYSCVILRLFEGWSLADITADSLIAKFHDRYPKAVKKAMSAEIERLAKSDDPISKYLAKPTSATQDFLLERLNVLRMVIHQVEYAACTGDKVTKLFDMDKCNSSEEIFHENYYLRGDCCRNKHLPLPINFLQPEQTPKLVDKAMGLALNVGVYPHLQSSVRQYNTYNKYLSYEDSFLQNMCLSAAYMLSLTQTPVLRDFMYHPDPTAVGYETYFPDLTKWYPKDLQEEVMQVLKSLNETDMEIDRYVHTNYNTVAETEFDKCVHRERLFALMVHCEQFNFLLREVERPLLKYCRGWTE